LFSENVEDKLLEEFLDRMISCRNLLEHEVKLN
jgi:hypothetical protein